MFDQKLEILIKDILNNGIKIQNDTRSVSIDTNLFNNLIVHLQSNTLIVENFDSCMINTGSGFSSIALDSLGKWLVSYSYDHNINETIKSLNDYLKISDMPGVAILAVSGIVPKEKIQISDNIDLVPFESLPSSRIKEELYPDILKQEVFFISPSVNNYNPPKAALIKRIKLSPKSYREEKTNVKKIDYSDLFEACMFLTLYSNATPVPATYWSEPEEHVPCKDILDNSVSFPSFLELSRNDRPITTYDWDRLKPLYQKFMTLSQQDRDHLKIPIQRLNQARRRLSYEDKAIDQGIAMEALFLNDQSGNEQISLMLRLRASLWLGTNIEEKEKLLHLFSAVYSCRSKAVHMGKVANEIKISYRGKVQTGELLKESDQLSVDAIKKIINYGGFPDWNKLMLGGIEVYGL